MELFLARYHPFLFCRFSFLQARKRRKSAYGGYQQSRIIWRLFWWVHRSATNASRRRFRRERRLGSATISASKFTMSYR
ncbi:hypothetical protein KPSA3_00909 [Pseudomonas syringae pv. actinidiae]|uniref:Uncharacterized protein n=1 Tax=Pseudomonas syringae pv. actinidiae TaxID=103796 RepID=A0AAN4Q0J7_PSESF|nr:hypothetical protein KPSA3_00909 [Pseudomonas syringae pv. actinidiae]